MHMVSKFKKKRHQTQSIDSTNHSLHNLLELGAVPEPNADWLGCCPNTGGWLLLDTAPKVGGGAGWEPAENNDVEDDMEPKLGGFGWLAPWLCPNVGVWLAPNAGLADGAECPVPNTKEDPGSEKNKSTTSRFAVRLLLRSSVNPQTNFRPLYRLYLDCKHWMIRTMTLFSKTCTNLTKTSKNKTLYLCDQQPSTRRRRGILKRYNCSSG